MSSSNSCNNLSDFLGFESKCQQSCSDDTGNYEIIDHAIDQLLEAKLGDEITLCAKRLAMGNDRGDNNPSLLEDEVEKLMGSPAYQQIHAEIKHCSPSLLVSCNENQKATDEDRSEGSISNKKSKESIDAMNKPAAATTSFSLFDLMDSQKGAFTLPPRIMAHQIINAYQRDSSTSMETTSDPTKNSENASDDYNYFDIDQSTNTKSALELLEQAEDLEDLSPDIESWEQIQSILYRGLVKTDVDERRRYFNVHQSLFEKCCKRNNGGMFRSQTWGLTNNIVGLILFLSAEFEKDEISDLDLYWDSCHHLLSSLSHLAVDHVTSCVGNEKEIERMILGLSYILCSDVSACVLAMMEPIAGWFEVWARFVERRKLMGIVSMSGLVEVALKRCEGRGKNEASKRLCELLHQSDDNSELPTLEDVENSTVLQSLSLLRVIASRCDTKSEIIGSISPFTSTSSPFLGFDGIISCDEVQTMLENRTNIEIDGSEEKSSSKEEQYEIIARLLKPFNDILLLKESTPGVVDTVLEQLCTQTVSLVDQLL